jgi:hypothetical protein
MTINDLVPFEERRRIARNILENSETKYLIEKIIKKRINPGFIVSFDDGENKITGIVSKMCFEFDKYDIVTCAEIVPFSEWGKVPESQNKAVYRLEDMKNYNIISDGKPKD